MHIHILGICGTFMGSLALLAKQKGHRVSGCDANVYPPMSTQLEANDIALIEGFDPQQLDPRARFSCRWERYVSRESLCGIYARQ